MIPIDKISYPGRYRTADRAPNTALVYLMGKTRDVRYFEQCWEAYSDVNPSPKVGPCNYYANDLLICVQRLLSFPPCSFAKWWETLFQHSSPIFIDHSSKPF